MEYVDFSVCPVKPNLLLVHPFLHKIRHNVCCQWNNHRFHCSSQLIFSDCDFSPTDYNEQQWPRQNTQRGIQVSKINPSYAFISGKIRIHGAKIITFSLECRMKQPNVSPLEVERCFGGCLPAKLDIDFLLFVALLISHVASLSFSGLSFLLAWATFTTPPLAH